MTTKTPTNIELVGSVHNNRVAVCCDYDGARYHVWVDRTSFALTDPVIFKNPPLDVQHRGKGDFPTRHLDVNGATGRKLVPLLLAAAPVLAPAFEQRLIAEVADEEAKRQEAMRIARIKEAAPVLLAALEAMVETFGNSTVLSDYGRGVVAQANAAITEARGEDVLKLSGSYATHTSRVGG